MTRGQFNNNYGNIRRSSSRWLGLSSVQTDKSFFQFVSPEYGLRALLVLLRTYHYKYHLNTISQVISRFAPSNENNTQSYINYVEWKVYQINGQSNLFLSSEELRNLPFNSWLNRKTPSIHVFALVVAICYIESKVVLSEELYQKAVELL